jgi:TetR/AcrR family transcriptional repressor of uid operon
MPITVLAVDDDDRRIRILHAAERAFTRYGFHGATMQLVALEAGMSAGNLYRTFASKEEIVSGLAARDQCAFAEDFDGLDSSGDLAAMMEPMLRKHLVDAPVERHRLALEIWAEAGRNRAVAAICLAIEMAVRARLVAAIRSSRPAGVEAEGLDPEFAVRVMFTVVAGLLKRRALEPDFDAEAEIALALGILRALSAGAVRPVRSGLEGGIT